MNSGNLCSYVSAYQPPYTFSDSQAVNKMARVISIGIQNFEQVISNQYFYVDKTGFIKEWWENGDIVTLITRPRRFGKTLAMDMVKRFFSVEYSGQRDIFKGLSVCLE